MTPAAQRRGGEEGGPLYRWLAGQLSQRIALGEIRPGAPLPPERKLAEAHAVSRVTVRRAVEQLAREGLVEQRRGSGTYVTPRLSQPLSALTSFSEDVAARGLMAQSRLVSRGTGTVTPEEAIGLGVPPGAKMSRITRLRRVEGSPLALEALERRGLRPMRAVQRLSAVALDAGLARLLEAGEGAPGLAILRVGYAADGRVVE